MDNENREAVAVRTCKIKVLVRFDLMDGVASYACWGEDKGVKTHKP